MNVDDDVPLLSLLDSPLPCLIIFPQRGTGSLYALQALACRRCYFGGQRTAKAVAVVTSYLLIDRLCGLFIHYM